MATHDLSKYRYHTSRPSCATDYLFPILLKELTRLNRLSGNSRLFEIGCGNGATAAALSARGYTVVGVDPSEEGIRLASMCTNGKLLHLGSAYDDLASQYGKFDTVISLEVVEHLFFPRKFAACVYNLLEPGGTALISTPYHGYWKNLVLALSGKMDCHFTALWDYGHIKFWSIRTLTQLLTEAGFQDVRFHRIGRVPILARSMMAVAVKPVAPSAHLSGAHPPHD